MIEIYTTHDGDKIGTLKDDGTVVSGDADRLRNSGVVDFVSEHDTEDIIARFDGPGLVAFEVDDATVDTKAGQWIPYEGPQGGEGWRNIDTDEVVYQSDPPGETMDPEDFVDAARDAGVSEEQVRDFASVLSGTSGSGPSGSGEGDKLAKQAVQDMLYEADTREPSAETLENIEDTMTHDVSNVTDPSIAEKWTSHIGKIGEPTMTFEDGSKRASCSPAAKHGGPDAQATIRISEEDSSRTISHEFGHAFVDAFGYNNPLGTGVSHNAPDEGLPDWDFGPDGEHGLKKQYMLTHYGDYEERGDHDWSEYEANGEEVGAGEVSVGDRLAYRDEGGTVYEGSVRRTAMAVDDVDQLNPGDQIEARGAEALGYGGSDPLGTVVHESQDLEVEEVIEDNGGYYLEEGEPPEPLSPSEYTEMARRRDELEGDVFSAPFGAALARDDSGGLYKVKEPHVRDAPGAPDYAVYDEVSGDRKLLRDDADFRLMEGREDRDWVPAEDMKTEPLKGETVKFSFGAQEEATEGVVIEENDAQITVEYDEDGERQLKQINKSQAYNQQVYVADDRTEFDAPNPEGEPAGYREAKYDHMDLSEEDVDWNTRIQYMDEAERLDQFVQGDLLLIRGPDGDRHTLKVSDSFPDNHADGEALRLQGDVGPGGWSSMTIDDYLAVGEDTDYDIMGHAPKEQFVDRPRGEPAQPEDFFETHDFDNVDNLESLEDGDRVKMTKPGEDRTEYATVRQDPVEDYAILDTDDHSRYIIDYRDDEPELMTPGPDDEKEWHGHPNRYVVTKKVGERLDGGFKTRGVEDVEEGMLVQTENDGEGTSVGEVDRVEDGQVVLDDGSVVDGSDLHRAGYKQGAQPESDDGERSPEDKVRDLIAEVNKAWHKMAHAREYSNRPSKYHIQTDYSETNANETFTKLQETMQNPHSGFHAVAVARKYPELVSAYTEVMEPSDAVKERLNSEYEDNPHRMPFDGKPYPEVEE